MGRIEEQFGTAIGSKFQVNKAAYLNQVKGRYRKILEKDDELQRLREEVQELKGRKRNCFWKKVYRREQAIVEGELEREIREKSRVLVTLK